MLLFRSLLPAACSKPLAVPAASNAVARLLSTSTSSSSSDGPTRGRTAGELGDDAAQSMRGAEDKAAGAGEKVEPKVSQGFVPEADTVISPDVAGRTGGIGADVMGDMMDMMGAAIKGDDKRAANDVTDMARQGGDVATSPGAKPPHTTSQDWPRGSITDPNASPASHTVGDGPFVNTDEASGAGIDRYEGTIPRTDPSEELPDVDQDPPESAAAGPTPGYAARAENATPLRGSDTRPI